MDVFKLSRNWFDWCFENPEKIRPTHTALYFFAIEHSNRLGWKTKFGLPTEMAKDAIGVKSWHVYMASFNDLVKWNFFKLIEKSKNQYSSNIIALSENDKATDKALDKAMIKHLSKQQRSTYQSNNSIDIHKTINNKQETIPLLIPQGNEKKESEFLELIEEEWRPLIKWWFEYKSERGQGYNGITAMKTVYSRIIKISNGNLDEAKEIIQNAITGNYPTFQAAKASVEKLLTRKEMESLLYPPKITTDNFEQINVNGQVKYKRNF